MLGSRGGLSPSHLPTYFLEEPQRSRPLAPLSLASVWVPESRLAVFAAELGAGWAGGREDTGPAGEPMGVGGRLPVVGASAYGHLNAQSWPGGPGEVS